MFFGYGQYEFGYRLYDLVKKKLIRSQDVVFVEDQTIADIKKIDEPKSKHSNNRIDLSSTSLTQLSTHIEDEVQNEQFFFIQMRVLNRLGQRIVFSISRNSCSYRCFTEEIYQRSTFINKILT